MNKSHNSEKGLRRPKEGEVMYGGCGRVLLQKLLPSGMRMLLDKGLYLRVKGMKAKRVCI